jgi:hypothetical protein
MIDIRTLADAVAAELHRRQIAHNADSAATRQRKAQSRQLLGIELDRLDELIADEEAAANR